MDLNMKEADPSETDKPVNHKYVLDKGVPQKIHWAQKPKAA